MTDAEFTDPRLVAIYDTVNAYPAGTQPEFYAQLASELGARSIVDLGCGTGLITRALARQGYRMIGVDPAPRMIDVARQHSDGAQVQWIVGGARDIGTPNADLAIMTGHVAQFFLSDESWREALVALRAALRPGGHLAFESRNPDAREWERWTREHRWSADDPVAGEIESWSEVQRVQDGTVSYTNHYAFATTGEELVAPSRLRFRTEAELRRSLADAGLAVTHVYGGWDRESPGTASKELIVIARA